MLFAAIVLMANFSSNLSAQSTVTGTSAGAVIITPIALSQDAALNFGVMSVLPGTGGTCILSTTGVRSSTGGVNLSTIGTAATNAAYTVGGLADATYSITLPSSITVTETVGAVQTMNINGLLARSASAGSNGLTGSLNSGADTFTVGGTLNVAASQLAGTYSGTFDVTVAYN